MRRVGKMRMRLFVISVDRSVGGLDTKHEREHDIIGNSLLPEVIITSVGLRLHRRDLSDCIKNLRYDSLTE